MLTKRSKNGKYVLEFLSGDKWFAWGFPGESLNAMIGVCLRSGNAAKYRVAPCL